VFNADDPLTRDKDRDYGESEIPALTAFVSALWAELQSVDALPVPPCPHCNGDRARFHTRANAYHAVPYFRCADCRRLFTRLTGSPIARLRFATKMPEFFRLLSRPLPLE
jgi:transposase-like protein